MAKIIKTYEEAKSSIVNAVNSISNPVIQTLSPMGGNVMFEGSDGSINVTNDGVTIARQIDSDDPLESKVIDVIRFASLQTNSEAGDGTTTAILLTKTLMTEGMRLLDNGMNRLELKSNLEEMSKKLIEKLETRKIEVSGPEDLFNIATISANNDEEIAKDIVEIIESAGQDGLIVIENNNKPETKVVAEPGFLLKSGLVAQELVQNRGYSSTMEDVAVLITDKRLYYDAEAEHILTTAIQAGHKKLVIVASDFIGTTLNIFMANHIKGYISLILVKESDARTLEDLATYLGGKVVTEKTGSLVESLSSDDFVTSTKVFSNQVHSIFRSSDAENVGVTERIKGLRGELEDNADDKDLELRLAALTNGTVTVKVGGHTPIETQEKIYRYEDAVNATRAAQKDGYVVGGGLTLLSLLEGQEWAPEMVHAVQRYCESSVRQIAINSGKHADSVIDETEIKVDNKYYCGYNAKINKFGDLLADGVIDPFKVTKMAIQNSISVTTALLTSGYFIVNDISEDNKE